MGPGSQKFKVLPAVSKCNHITVRNFKELGAITAVLAQALKPRTQALWQVPNKIVLYLAEISKPNTHLRRLGDV